MPADEVEATPPGADAILRFESSRELVDKIQWAETPSFLLFSAAERGEYGYDFVRLKNGSFRLISHVARELTIDFLGRHVGHTSLVQEGAEVIMAGELFVNRLNKIVHVTNLSGHYRPSEETFRTQTGRPLLSRAALEAMRGAPAQALDWVSVREYDQYLSFRVHEIAFDGGSFLEKDEHGWLSSTFVCGDFRPIVDAVVSSVLLSTRRNPEADPVSIILGGGYDATLRALISRARWDASVLESEEDRYPLGGLPHDSEEVLRELFSRVRWDDAWVLESRWFGPAREKERKEHEILAGLLSRSRELNCTLIGGPVSRSEIGCALVFIAGLIGAGWVANVLELVKL